MSDGGAVSAVWRAAFRAALSLYPRAARRDDGPGMWTVFNASLRRASARGEFAVLATALAELTDLARNGLIQRIGGGSISRSARHRFGRQSDAIGTLIADARYAARGLIRRPGFSAVIVLVIAVGIGASTAVFSVYDSAILNPLPFRDAERIVEVWRALDGNSRVTSWGQSEVERVDFWTAAGAMEEIVGWDVDEVDLTGVGEPRALRIANIDPATLQFLGVRPIAGRDFVAKDGLEGAPPIALLSRALARQLAPSPESTLDLAVELDGVSHRIVGVLPSGFGYPMQNVEAWTPVTFGSGSRLADLRPRLFGRLAEGMDVASATERANAASRAEGADMLLYLERADAVSPSTRTALSMLLAGVGLLLLTACANTGNLLLIAYNERQREVALRTALGAGRWRLVRQALLESVMLALAGGAVGALIAHGLLAVVVDIAPRDVAVFTANAVDVDPRALGFTLVLAFGTALLFGAAPAWRGSRQEPREALGGGGRTTDASNRRLRQGLVIAEVAMAVVLLLGAGLLSGSLLRLTQVDLGFDTESTYSVSLRPSSSRYPTGAEQSQLLERMAGRLRLLPDVETVAVASGLPIDGANGYHFGLEPEADGLAAVEHDPELIIPSIGVGPGYFEALGIAILDGRGFEQRELESSEGLVVLSETMARRYFGDASPVGRQFRLGPDAEWMTVVGVAAEVPSGGVQEPMGTMEMYFPLRSEGRFYRVALVLRLRPGARDVAARIRAALAAEDPLQPIEAIASADRVLWGLLSTERFYLSLAGTFALAALVLAALGIYGVMAYTVNQRTREIGIRVALGAERSHVRLLVVRMGTALAGSGVLVGLVVGWWSTTWLEAHLYELRPNDPSIFGLVTGVTLLVALIASWLPARRALRVDPMEALRAD